MAYKYDEERVKESERGFAFFHKKAGETDEASMAENARKDALYGEALIAAEEFYKYLAERDDLYKEMHKPEHQDLLLAETKYVAEQFAKHADIAFQIVEGITSKPPVAYVGKAGNFSNILDMVEKKFYDDDKLTLFIQTLESYGLHKDDDFSEYKNIGEIENYIFGVVSFHFTIL